MSDLSNYNVIGCAGGENCVCQDGYGHRKYAQTSIAVPLAEKSKEELVRIVEMMQEDLQWYVAERNRLIAAQPAASPVAPAPLNQRGWDLLRQMRHQLHEEKLITDEEYAELVEIPGSVKR